jgi:hypothetical protein
MLTELEDLKLFLCGRSWSGDDFYRPQSSFIDFDCGLEDTEFLRELTQLKSLEFRCLTDVWKAGSSFEALTNLTKLIIHESEVHFIFDTISELTKLTTLNLIVHHSTGCLESCSNLIHLSELKLRCGLYAEIYNDVSFLSSLTKLHTLHLVSCKSLDGNLSSLSALTRLVDLNLSAMPKLKGDIQDISGRFSKMRCLEVIDLDCFTGDLSALSGLNHSLTSLTIIECSQLEGNIATLNALTRLNVLDIRSCVNLHGDTQELDVEPPKKLQILGPRIIWPIKYVPIEEYYEEEDEEEEG